MNNIPFLLIITILISYGCNNKVEILDNARPFAAQQYPAKKRQVKLIRVAIAPYNEIDSLTTYLIASQFEKFYLNVKTLILPTACMDDSLLAHSKTRYNANKILTHLAMIKPQESNFILAITNDKIAACGDSIHESGVAGLGDRPGYCCVVSTDALKNKLTDTLQFNPRLIKACMHEMGHNFGLSHCKSKDKKCIMRDAAGTIVTLDEEDIHLCKKCTDLLKEKGIHLKCPDY